MNNKFKIGNSASVTRVLTEKIISMYGDASGDKNPLHFNDEYARSKGFNNGRIAHGLFCIGMVSYLIGMVLPGEGAIFLDEVLSYVKPVYLGDTITTTVKISGTENNIITVEFCCTNQNNKEVLTGKTSVLIRGN